MIRQDSNYNEWNDYYEFWRKYTSDVDRIYYHNIFLIGEDSLMITNLYQKF